MDDSANKKWIIKDSSGRVRGPFSTDEVLGRIRRGDFSGEEKLALFPGTDWMPISSAPEFYDQLLSVLEGEASQEDILDQGFIEFTPTPSHSEEGEGEKVDAADFTFSDEKPKRGKSERIDEKPPKDTPKDKTKKKKKEEQGQQGDPVVIELKKTKRVLKKAKRKSAAKPIIILIIAAIALIFFVDFGGAGSGEAIHLLRPEKGKSGLAKDKIQELTKRAVAEFTANNYTSLVRAQNTLVQIFEGDNRNSAALSMLCLTYLELWPHAYQDSEDLQTLTRVTQMSSQVDPGGVDGNTCRVVDLYLGRKSEEANSTVDSVLERYSASENPPIAFYYLKAKLLESSGNYSNALGFISSAQQLWPQWLGAFVLEAEILIKAKQYENATQKLNFILKSNPQHSKAQVMLGLMEMRHFKNYERGESFISAGLNSSDRIPAKLSSEAYLAKAEAAYERGDKNKALDLAQKSYSLNSTNETSKTLILQLGGKESLKKTKLKDRQLVFEGDQLVREGNCAGAQALYKTAFETNDQNAIAAMKAAECLWKLSLSSQAIDWLNKAVRADPKLVDAYVLLSDYYSQRFLFQSAARSLSSANAAVPSNYKVFRGYALLDLRRKNGRGAVQNAEQAVSLYESDVESYVILAKAWMMLDDYNKALSAARKAQELNINHRDAQIVLGETLFGAQGSRAAQNFMLNLVSTYPLVTEYRMALGDLYFKDQNYHEARTLFQQVSRMEDKPKAALMRLGDLEIEEKKYTEALNFYLKAASLDPSDVEPLFRAGKLYLLVNKPQEAQKQFSRVMNINKDYPLVHYYLGMSALAMKLPKEAIKEAEIEKLKNPKLADPYMLAAEAHASMGQYNNCATEYQKAVGLRPGSSEIYVKMARCYRLAGQIEGAISMIRKARNLESGNAEVWKERALIYETQGDGVRAVESYNQYLVLQPNAPDAFQIQQKIDRLLSQ